MIAPEAELIRALAGFAESPQPGRGPLEQSLGVRRPPTAEEHTDLFVLQLPPYASIYLGDEGMIGGEARDRVAGFWRALRLTPPTDPDHMVSLLALYAALSEAADAEEVPARRRLHEQACAALLWEHLVSWLPAYLSRVLELGPPPYRQWARMLRAALDAESGRFDPPAAQPVHLRASCALAEGDLERDLIVPALLSPMRSGLIITRADLARCSRTLALGLRVGERAYILRALVDQDPRATLRWMAAEADRQALLWQPSAGRWRPILDVWTRRATTTAWLLRALLDDRGASGEGGGAIP